MAFRIIIDGVNTYVQGIHHVSGVNKLIVGLKDYTDGVASYVDGVNDYTAE